MKFSRWFIFAGICFGEHVALVICIYASDELVSKDLLKVPDKPLYSG